jgi:hypothetical protein
MQSKFNKTFQQIGYTGAILSGLLSNESFSAEQTKLPAEVQAYAKKMFIDPKNIALKNGTWVVCDGDFCSPLSIAVNAGAVPKIAGQVLEINPPNYVRGQGKEFHQNVIKHLQAHKDQFLMVVVTVPAQCDPCRSYEPIVRSFAKNNAANSDLKIIVVQFDTFSDAYNFIGSTKDFSTPKFPYTMFLSPMSDSWKKHFIKNGDPPGKSLETYEGKFFSYATKYRCIRAESSAFDEAGISGELSKLISFYNKNSK